MQTYTNRQSAGEYYHVLTCIGVFSFVCTCGGTKLTSKPNGTLSSGTPYVRVSFITPSFDLDVRGAPMRVFRKRQVGGGCLFEETQNHRPSCLLSAITVPERESLWIALYGRRSGPRLDHTHLSLGKRRLPEQCTEADLGSPEQAGAGRERMSGHKTNWLSCWATNKWASGG